MTAYYNEIDPYAAAWLRNLVAAGRIAPGDVDERSIRDVSPDDLKAYTQCHFFAGIGVWSAALRLAGWADDRPVWTGSCPCQPFSVAGNGAGFADDRHLWPEMFRLIAERRPPVVFGEQVASKDGLAWLDLVHTDLEGADYAAAAVDLCAAGVGAPHIRQRLYWVADTNHAERGPDATRGDERHGSDTGRPQGSGDPERCVEPSRLADTAGERHDGRGAGEASAESREIERLERLRDASGVGNANSAGQQACDREPFGDEARPKQSAHTSSHSGLADTQILRREGSDIRTAGGLPPLRATDIGEPSGLGNANSEGLAQRGGIARVPSGAPGGNEGQAAERAGGAYDGGLADTDAQRHKEQVLLVRQRADELQAGSLSDPRPVSQQGSDTCRSSPTNGQWRDADWLFCRDGKWRPVEPGTFPLAHGATSRVGRLRAYGNAIVPQVAAEVIGSWMDFNQ